MNLRRIARYLPRSLRIAALHPVTFGLWIASEARALLGKTARCRLTESWDVRCHPAALPAFESLARDPGFAEELAAFERHASPGMVLFDLGANYGVFTLAALRLDSANRVVAVEPSPTAMRILAVNVKLAQASDRVIAVREAVGRATGTLELLTAGPFGHHYMTPVPQPRNDSTVVPVDSLPGLVERVGVAPTHLKIDVEGFELDVLEGATSLLADRRPTLFLELHNDILQRSGRNPASVVELLGELGYDRFEIGDRRVQPDGLLDADVVRAVCRASEPATKESR